MYINFGVASEEIVKNKACFVLVLQEKGGGREREVSLCFWTKPN